MRFGHIELEYIPESVFCGKCGQALELEKGKSWLWYHIKPPVHRLICAIYSISYLLENGQLFGVITDAEEAARKRADAAKKAATHYVRLHRVARTTGRQTAGTPASAVTPKRIIAKRVGQVSPIAPP